MVESQNDDGGRLRGLMGGSASLLPDLRVGHPAAVSSCLLYRDIPVSKSARAILLSRGQKLARQLRRPLLRKS